MVGIFCKVWMVWMDLVGSKCREFELPCITLRYAQCHLPAKFWVLLIAGLHVTSQQPCWWCVRGQKKSISLLWELNPIFCKLFEKKFYRIDHQHTTNMAAFSRGCKPRIWVLSKSFINPFVRDEWIWLGKDGLSRSWLPEADLEAHKKGLVRIMPSKWGGRIGCW